MTHEQIKKQILDSADPANQDLRLLCKAAEEGDAQAKYDLACLYRCGRKNKMTGSAPSADF